MVSPHASLACSPSSPAAAKRMPREKMTRPPFERMNHIHEQLVAGRFPNCSSVAARFEVATRTIQRDFEYMRDRLRLPIAYDPSQRGFYYYDHVDAMPTAQMSPEDCTSLLIARQALAQYTGSPWAPRIGEIIGRISPGGAEQAGLEAIEAAVSFHTLGTPNVDPEVFRGACEAVLGRREVHFRYRKYHSSRPDHRRVHPYHLTCVNGAWYLLGLNLERGKIRVYALDLIHELTLTPRTFVRPADFSPRDYFGRTFGIVVEKGIKEVVLRFRGRAAWQVSQRLWHPTQTLTPIGHQEVEMRFRVSSLREVVSWVLGWGPQVTVLGPVELTREVSAQVQAVAALYAPAPLGQPPAPSPEPPHLLQGAA